MLSLGYLFSYKMCIHIHLILLLSNYEILMKCAWKLSCATYLDKYYDHPTLRNI
jgi:hypothetical protein